MPPVFREHMGDVLHMENLLSVSDSIQTQILYARGAEGSLPVRVITHEGSKRFELFHPDRNEPEVFTSSRSLLVSLTGHPSARNWTFDRYFRQGRFAPPSSRWIGQPDPQVMSELWRPTIIKSIPYGSPGNLGIDLKNRGHEVAKLLFAGFGHWIHSAGYDPQDVLQEVYRGILARNIGKCPWDARKSSFGHYVHMVCRGVLSNYHRKIGRERGHEQSGLGVVDEGGFEIVDVSEANLAAPETSELVTLETTDALKGLDLFLSKETEPEAPLARSILPMLAVGMDRAEIAGALGLSKSTVAKGITYLRETTRKYMSLSD